MTRGIKHPMRFYSLWNISLPVFLVSFLLLFVGNFLNAENTAREIYTVWQTATAFQIQNEHHFWNSKNLKPESLDSSDSSFDILPVQDQDADTLVSAPSETDGLNFDDSKSGEMSSDRIPADNPDFENMDSGDSNPGNPEISDMDPDPVPSSPADDGYMEQWMEQVKNLVDHEKSSQSQIPEMEIASELLNRYGYSVRYFLDQLWLKVLVLTALEAAGLTCITWAGLYVYGSRQNRQLEALSRMVEKLEKEETLPLIPEKVDQYSALRDEIMKLGSRLIHQKNQALQLEKSHAHNLENIAHQIKTPLTALSMTLEQTDENVLPQKQTMLQKTGHINQLLSLLLMEARLDSHAVHFQQEKVDVFTMLEMAAESLEEMADVRSIRIIIPEKGELSYTGDLVWSVEALICIFTNAVKASPDNSTIDCDYEENPLYIEIIIRDQGKGMSSQEIRHLFDRFYTASQAPASGFGIGMSLARSIIEKQNGVIQVTSAVRQGTTFSIRFYKTFSIRMSSDQ